MPHPEQKPISQQARFIVSFDLPPDATVQSAQAYVLDAVASMKGALKPPFFQTAGGVTVGDEGDPEGDPMFNLDNATIRVTRIGPSMPRHELVGLKEKVAIGAELTPSERNFVLVCLNAIASS